MINNLHIPIMANEVLSLINNKKNLSILDCTFGGGGHSKKFLEKGMTLIEALVSTAIVAIGFIAIFQMVSYSVQAVDVSNERTKTGYLTSMVAEDLLADRYADFSGKKLYEHMVANRPTTGDKNSWEMASCTDGSAAGTTASNVLAEKINKWDKRFSTRRIKCDTSNPGKKSLKVFNLRKLKLNTLIVQIVELF